MLDRPNDRSLRDIYAVGPRSATTISVAGSKAIKQPPTASFPGRIPTAINQTTLTINSGRASDLTEVWRGLRRAGANASGLAISMPSAGPRRHLRGHLGQRAVIAAGPNGNTIKWSRGQITQVAGAGCVGMRMRVRDDFGATIRIVST